MIRLHPLVGHEAARRALARAHRAGSLPAALLLHGARGVGKQRAALWVAQLRLCDAPDPESGPCGACRPCRLVLGLEHPDVHWFFPLDRPRGATGDRLGPALESARIDALAEWRDQPLRPSAAEEARAHYLAAVQAIRARAHLAPTMARTQIFVVGEAERLVPQESSPEAANALLKLLEEPPPSTAFVLTSSEPGRLLPTIRSRTVPFHLSPLPREAVAAFLAEHAGVEPGPAAWAAGLAQGSVGRALGFLPAGDAPGPLEKRRLQALEVVEAALSGSAADGYALGLAQPLARARALVGLFAFVEEWLRDLGAVAAGAEERVLNADHLPRLCELVEGAGVEADDAARALSAAEEARELVRGNVNPQLVVSGLVRRLRRVLRPRRVAVESGP